MFLLTLLLLAPATQVKGTASPANVRLHADVWTLLELNGVKKRMEDSAPQALDDAQELMQRQCPKCTPEFFVEFKKRMLLRNTTALCMSATAAEYEKYLSDKDVVELISLQKARIAGQQVAPSEELKTKLAAVLPGMMAETMGKCSEFGAKNGIEVATEIAKEHPEYLNGPSASHSPQ